VTTDNAYPVISLFSGAGGLDLAAEQGSAEDEAGSGRRLRVAVATDNEPLALQTLSLNMPETRTLCSDIRETPTQALLDLGELGRGDAALVIGGPPCTPFSKSGFWLKEKRESRDPDASLLDEYVRVVKEARPEAFVLENVQALTYRTHQKQFERLISHLRELGYNPQWQVLLAAEYGVPQLRRRVFVVGRRDGKPFIFPSATHSGASERDRVFDPAKVPFVTSAEALAGLRDNPPEPGEIVEGTYARLAASIPPGQNYLWHTSRYGGEDAFEWRTRYWTFLLRLDPDRPATTIQAQPGPWVGPFHWENTINDDGEQRARRLRVPEMLRLMTFPDGFKLAGGRSDAQRQLGNAVPVKLGATVIRALLIQLGYLSPRSDEEELMAKAGDSRQLALF